MDKKLHETTYLCVEIMNSKRRKGETWSRGTNSRLPFDVNVILNPSSILFLSSPINEEQCWSHNDYLSLDKLLQQRRNLGLISIACSRLQRSWEVPPFSTSRADIFACSLHLRVIRQCQLSTWNRLSAWHSLRRKQIKQYQWVRNGCKCLPLPGWYRFAHA